jgi:uncharacterized protein
MMYPVAYHAAMTLLLATAVWAARRDRRPRAWVIAAASVAAAAALLAVGLGDGRFGTLRLLAYGLFGFTAAVLAAGAAALARGHRRYAMALAGGFLVIEAVAIDAFLIEPHWLDVRTVRLHSDKISRPIKIAILADLQTDEIGEYERSVLARVIDAQPDLILLAGDYIQDFDHAARRRLHRELRASLQAIDFGAPLGAYAVRGNVDSDGWTTSFEQTRVTTSRETRSFDVGELRIVALSVADSFAPNLSVSPSDRFQIVLGHCPNFALGDVRADLLVAGHTHGGQVRLPGLGPIITLSRVPRGWAAGVADIGQGRTLIVSRGIGMERGPAPRLRFLCRPELVFVELLPAAAEGS